jgi:hypothetical protein
MPQGSVLLATMTIVKSTPCSLTWPTLNDGIIRAELLPLFDAAVEVNLYATGKRCQNDYNEYVLCQLEFKLSMNRVEASSPRPSPPQGCGGEGEEARGGGAEMRPGDASCGFFRVAVRGSCS